MDFNVLCYKTKNRIFVKINQLVCYQAATSFLSWVLFWMKLKSLVLSIPNECSVFSDLLSIGTGRSGNTLIMALDMILIKLN